MRNDNLIIYHRIVSKRAFFTGASTPPIHINIFFHSFRASSHFVHLDFYDALGSVRFYFLVNPFSKSDRNNNGRRTRQKLAFVLISKPTVFGRWAGAVALSMSFSNFDWKRAPMAFFEFPRRGSYVFSWCLSAPLGLFVF